MKNTLHFLRKITPMLALAALILAPFWGWGQIASWSLTSDGSPSGVNTNITAGNFTSAGVGLLTFGASGASANGWTTSANIDLTDYFEITISPNSGYTINVSAVNFGERRSGTGIRNYQVRWSIDNFANSTTIATVSVPDDTNERDGSITGLNINVADGQTLKIRWYGYNSEAAGGTWRINDGTLNIVGSVTAGSSNDTDTEVYAPTTQIAAKDISSLADTQAEGESVNVFTITIQDQGSGDELPTKVTNIRVKPHTSNTADWTNTIQSVFVDDGTDYLYPTATITDNYIDLAFGSADLNVADNSSLDVTLYIYFNTSGVVDGQILSFMVDADGHGFTADASGSGFASSFLFGDFNSGDMTISVEGTKLTFIQQPSNVILDLQMTPAVTVAFTDANGNIDIDYDGEGFGISLTSTGTFSASATTAVDAVNGVSTFNNLVFSALGSGITITANDEDLWGNTSATSNAFNVSNLPIQEAGILLFEENFDYTGLLTANGYTVLSGDGTNNLTSGITGLSYANYGSSGIGNALSVANNGQDVYTTFTKQNSSATVYASFLLNISEAKTGDYVFAFGPSAGASNFRGRLFIKGSATSGYLNFGISNGNTGTTYGSTNFALNTTHLVVVKYEFTSGSTATATVFINPNLFAQPATYEVSVTDITAGNAPADITHYAIRQGTAASAPTFVMDGIRIATDWGACLGNPQYDVASNIAAGNYNDVSVLSNTLSLIGNVAINGAATNNGNILIGGNTLAINGSISGSGIYTGGATSNISVGGTGANLTFPNVVNGLNNLTITRPNGISISSANSLTVAGTLTNSAGNAGLVIKSDVTGTGSLIHSNAGVPATIERYVVAANWATASDGWHLLSSPVASQSIEGDWIPEGANNDYDFYTLDETQLTDNWLNQKVGENNINTFETGKGYLVAYEQTGTKAFTGNVNVADVTLSGLTNTVGSAFPGWHLVGNPFASAIDYNLGTWTNTNIDEEIQVWSSLAGSYKTATEVGGIVPSMNGFMVHTSGSGVLTIPANARTHNAANWYKSDEEFILLKAHDLETNMSQSSIVRFNAMATEAYDADFDSYYLRGFAPAFYSVSGGDLYALNTLESMSNSLVIPFGFNKNVSNEFSIELAKSLTGTVVYLTDKKTNTVTNLTETPVYNFTSTEGDDAMRFTLSFGTLGINNPEATDGVQVYAYDGVLYLETPSKEAASVKVYNLTGQLVMQGRTGGNALSTFNASALSSGVYVVNVVLNQGVVSRKVVINK